MENNKILIIDDEEIVHESINDALEDEGYEVISAYNGEEGLKAYEVHKPILLILDLRMPVMNGNEFLVKLQVKPDAPYSVIVLTGHGCSEDMETCYDLGIRSFLQKPFNIYELRSLVQSCINLKRTELKLTSDVARREDAETQLGEYRKHLNKMFDSLKIDI
ncbi:MAG: response regulator [Desulfobulbaceae bacterium]|nr:response regulator [Desulfobulbaceae bacterium]HIJ90584.1 response regulator [Deltaproteobacteria bacterium]